MRGRLVLVLLVSLLALLAVGALTRFGQPSVYDVRQERCEAHGGTLVDSGVVGSDCMVDGELVSP